MHSSQETVDRLLEAAFARAAEDGWISVSIAEIASDAGVPVAEAFGVFPSKPAILDVLLQSVEARMLADLEPDFAESTRDRVFEVVMVRLDALLPYRAGLGRLLRELPGDPAALLALLPGLPTRLARMLEAAGVSTTGPLGLLRIKGFALVYFDTMRVWIDDDSPDMAKTMATLDRGLRRAESVMRFVDGILPSPFRPRGEAASPEVTAPTDDAAASDSTGSPTEGT